MIEFPRKHTIPHMESLAIKIALNEHMVSNRLADTCHHDIQINNASGHNEYDHNSL